MAVRLTSLTGQLPDLSGSGPGSSERREVDARRPRALGQGRIIIKASTRQGSAYAAMMVTGRHGVRMQYDYTGDVPGLAGSVFRGVPALAAAHPVRRHAHRLRLGRRHALDEGRHRRPGRPVSDLCKGGLFATSPPYWQTSLGVAAMSGGPSQATGVFDQLSLGGRWPDGGWTGSAIGAPADLPGLARGGPGRRRPVHRDRHRRHRAGGVRGGGARCHDPAQTLIGVFAGLIAGR